VQGAFALAAGLWGAAESLREHCGVPLTPVERADYKPAVAAVRTHPNEQVFHAAWTQGRTMTIEQVLATNTVFQGLSHFAIRPLCMLYSSAGTRERNQS
jgi:hypothetical protein